MLTKIDHLPLDADTLKEIVYFRFSLCWILCFCAPGRYLEPERVVIPVNSSCLTLLPWTLISHLRLCVAATILRSVLNRFNKASLRFTASYQQLLLFWYLQMLFILLIELRGLTSLLRPGNSGAMSILEARLWHHGWQAKRDVEVTIPLRVWITF